MALQSAPKAVDGQGMTPKTTVPAVLLIAALLLTPTLRVELAPSGLQPQPSTSRAMI